jgi:hypothetical protein
LIDHHLVVLIYADEELHNMFSSPNIIRQIRSRRMRWAGHVARMGEERKIYKISVGKHEGKNHSEDRGVDGRMGLECFWEIGWECGVDSSGSG